jgi:hypothetical protein
MAAAIEMTTFLRAGLVDSPARRITHGRARPFFPVFRRFWALSPFGTPCALLLLALD